MKNNTKLKAEIKRKSDEFRTLQQSAFREMLKCVFDAFPSVNSIGFVGHTPGFNDGDEIVFKCDTKYPIVNGYDSNQCEWADGAERSENEISEASDLADQISPILSEIPTNLLGGIFGTAGFKATITRDKIEVEEYDCGY